MTSSAQDNYEEEKVILDLQARVSELHRHVSFILLDTRLPGSAGGGAGVTFNWTLASKLNIPVLLAGGLNENNVKDAISLVNIAGVDVSSGVESIGVAGHKDPQKIRAFISKARGRV